MIPKSIAMINELNSESDGIFLRESAKIVSPAVNNRPGITVLMVGY